MNTTDLPATQNTDWGFWGTISNSADADTAWPLAMLAIRKATAQPLESVRAFLDSRQGRYFADEVQNELSSGKALPDAINAATACFMGWRIDPDTSYRYGIPRGLPYLTGFVMHCATAAQRERAVS